MGLEIGAQHYIPILNDLGVELYSFAGTPTGDGPKTGALVVDTTNGKLYINTGTVGTAVWNAIGEIATAELADSSVTTAKIADLNVTTGKLEADAVTNAKLADNAVSIENIDSAAKPILHTVAAGIFTTAGGDANESITAAGTLGTDTAIVWVQKAGATPRTVDTITPGTGSIAVVLSGDPSTDHKLAYMVVRAAA